MRLETSYSRKASVHPQVADAAVTQSELTGLPLSDVLTERARFYEGARVRLKPDKAEGWGEQRGIVEGRSGVHVWIVKIDERFRESDDGLREVTDDQMEVLP